VHRRGHADPPPLLASLIESKSRCEPKVPRGLQSTARAVPYYWAFFRKNQTFRYMEVAVRLASRTLSIALIAITLAGCADIITYSKDSRKEGLKLYSEQQWADAAGAFRNAARQNPLDYKSYCYLGDCYEQLGQHQEAIHAFRTSLEVMSKDIDGRYDIAFRQGVLNGLASAIAKCDQRDTEINDVENRAQTNNSAEEYFILGKIFAFRGDPDSAIDSYNHAMLTDPNNFFIAKEYGLYLVQLHQNDKAELPLRKAYSLKQDDEQVNNALRNIGVVPGPGVLDESALAKPLIPRGPIPELDVNKITGHGETQTNGEAASAPRD
jgi:tetratricopeptide (TPR) repeat protein